MENIQQNSLFQVKNLLNELSVHINRINDIIIQMNNVVNQMNMPFINNINNQLNEMNNFMLMMNQINNNNMNNMNNNKKDYYEDDLYHQIVKSEQFRKDTFVNIQFNYNSIKVNIPYVNKNLTINELINLYLVRTRPWLINNYDNYYFFILNGSIINDCKNKFITTLIRDNCVIKVIEKQY